MGIPIPGVVPEEVITELGQVTFPQGPNVDQVFYNFLTDTELSDWAFTAIGTNTGPTTVDDFDGGKVRINHTTATDDTGQAANYDSEFFKFAASRKYFWSALVRLDDGTNGDYRAGMHITTTTLADPTDGVFFSKDDGDTQLDVTIIKDNAGDAGTTNVATCDGSWHVWSIYIEVGGTVTSNKIVFLVDGTPVYIKKNTAELVDDEEMTLGFMAHNGATGAPNWLDVDWVFFKATRSLQQGAS